MWVHFGPPVFQFEARPLHPTADEPLFLPKFNKSAPLTLSSALFVHPFPGFKRSCVHDIGQ